MYLTNDRIRTFSPFAALIIWLLHLGMAIFFYARGDVYRLQAYQWGALFIILASYPYIRAIMKRTFLLYEAKYLFLAAFLLCHTAYMFLNLDDIELDYELWAYVMKLLSIGTVAFLIGYRFALGKFVAQKLPLRNFTIPETFMIRLPGRLYFVGWTLRLLPMLTVRLGPTAFLLTVALQRVESWYVTGLIMTNSIYGALMLDAYLSFLGRDAELRRFKRKRHLYRLLFFFTLEILYAFTVVGMKEALLVPTLLLFIMYLKAKKKIPYLAMILTIALFVGVIMPFMGIHRAERSQYTFGGAIEYSFERLFVEGEIQDGQTKAIVRLSNPLEISVVSAGLREQGVEIKTYRSLLDYFSRYIPRLVWPDKPIVDYNKIGKEMGIVGQDDYGTSVGLTLVGSLILNYGPYGVIIGLFLIGILLRTYWEWLIVRSGDNLFSYIIYFLVLYTWVRFDEFAICLHSNIAFFIYLYFIVHFLRKR